MQFITDVADHYTRGKWRGIGASFLIRLYDDETAVCSEMGTVATAQASLNHVSCNTTAGYLAYKFEGDSPQKLGKMHDRRRQAEGHDVLAGHVPRALGQEFNVLVKVHAPLTTRRKAVESDTWLPVSRIELHLVHEGTAIAAWPFAL